MHAAGMAAKPETLSEFGLRRVLAVLCVTEIVSWGVLYYAFPVLAPTIAGDTGWSIAAVTRTAAHGQPPTHPPAVLVVLCLRAAVW